MKTYTMYDALRTIKAPGHRKAPMVRALRQLGYEADTTQSLAELRNRCAKAFDAERAFREAADAEMNLKPGEWSSWPPSLDD